MVLGRITHYVSGCAFNWLPTPRLLSRKFSFFFSLLEFFFKRRTDYVCEVPCFLFASYRKGKHNRVLLVSCYGPAPLIHCKEK